MSFMAASISSETKSETRSESKEDLPDEEFYVAMLKKMLMAPAVADASSKNSESLKDGPPSCADVKLTASQVYRIIRNGAALFQQERTLLKIDKSVLPMLIVGDIHGQFLHLRSLFEMFGGPSETSLLFLGDYVDRGVQGIECVCLLTTMKLRYPSRVFMLRGNHEDANTTLSYGFQEECISKYGKREGFKIWKCFIEMFNLLPLAATVNKKILCMHGGLSPFMETLEDIDQIKRPLMIPPYGLATDLVWSDPDSKNPGWSLSHRGVSFTFNGEVVKTFCKKNDIELIVRGHQISSDMMSNGYKFFGDSGGRLLTIFSAPNYLNYHNAACVMYLTRSMKIQFTVFRSHEDPEKEETKVKAYIKERDKRKQVRDKEDSSEDEKSRSIEDCDTSDNSWSEETSAKSLKEDEKEKKDEGKKEEKKDEGKKEEKKDVGKKEEVKKGDKDEVKNKKSSQGREK